MANIYVRSTDGLDGDNGTTWALAKATLTGAAAIAVAGDKVYVSQVHAETSAAAISLAWAGTIASPIFVICGNDGAAPPTALATTATVTTTGVSSINLNATDSKVVYYYGISFFMGTGAGTCSFTTSIGPGRTTFDKCALRVVNTSGNAQTMGDSQRSITTMIDTDLRFGATGQNLYVPGVLRWLGGSLLAGGTTPTFLAQVDNLSRVYLDNVDLSNAATTLNLFVVDGGNRQNAVVACSRMKMPSSWTGDVVSQLLGATANNNGSLYELFSSDSAATNYRYRRAAEFGDIYDETTIVRTTPAGASDGTTPLSWKMVSNANAEYPMFPLYSQEFSLGWNESTGSALTATIDIVHDSVTALKDNEVWLEVNHLGTSGSPLGVWTTNRVALLATAANQTTSTSAWTTTGMSNPNKQKLQVTFTPQLKGPVIGRVAVAKASYTIYVDPPNSNTPAIA